MYDQLGSGAPRDGGMTEIRQHVDAVDRKTTWYSVAMNPGLINVVLKLCGFVVLLVLFQNLLNRFRLLYKSWVITWSGNFFCVGTGPWKNIALGYSVLTLHPL